MKNIETKNLTIVLKELLPADEAKGYVPQYLFDIQLKSDQQRVGHINLRVGNDDILNNYSGHISYGIDEAHRGNHYASEACRVILSLAFSFGIEPIRITCDPDNIASFRTCELAGGRYLGDVDVPPGNYVYDNGGRRKSRFEFTKK